MVRSVGVVLSGGAGKRMGAPKGALLFQESTLAERAVRALAPLCDRVLVSVAPGMPGVPGSMTIEDPHPAGRGPLAGLLAAFDATAGEDLLVLACDYPFADTPFWRGILSAARPDPEFDVSFPVDSSGRDHPLVGVWKHRCQSAIAEALFRGEHAVRAVVGVLRVRRLAAVDLALPNIDPFLANWNTPADLPRRPAVP